jgi:hypothetical protein
MSTQTSARRTQDSRDAFLHPAISVSASCASHNLVIVRLGDSVDPATSGASAAWSAM